MNYLIAGRVIYDTENGTLTDARHSDDIKSLTPTANRILTLLLSEPGQVFPRDDILDKVWAAQGHNCSNSSLNQYISILRKTLATWIDADEIILSVPKVGFCFSARLAVEPWMPEAPIVAPVAPGLLASKKKVMTVNLGLLLCLVVLLFLCVRQNSEARNASLYRVLYPVATLGFCEVTSWQNLSDELKSQALNVLHKVSPELKEKCLSQPAKVMFQVQRQVYQGQRGRVFITFCPYGKSRNAVLYCDSTYKYNWGSE